MLSAARKGPTGHVQEQLTQTFSVHLLKHSSFRSSKGPLWPLLFDPPTFAHLEKV